MSLANPSPVQYMTVDATSPVSVHVGQKAITAGVPGDPEHCAIAIAARRSIRGAVAVRVFRSSVWVETKGDGGKAVITLYNLDGAGRNLVASMDTTKTASPTRIALLPRPKSSQQAARRVQNARRAARVKAGIPANPKYHSAGGAKGTARTLAGVRRGR